MSLKTHARRMEKRLARFALARGKDDKPETAEGKSDLPRVARFVKWERLQKRLEKVIGRQP
jgi:hypothetical protein